MKPEFNRVPALRNIHGLKRPVPSLQMRSIPIHGGLPAGKKLLVQGKFPAASGANRKLAPFSGPNARVDGIVSRPVKEAVGRLCELVFEDAIGNLRRPDLAKGGIRRQPRIEGAASSRDHIADAEQLHRAVIFRVNIEQPVRSKMRGVLEEIAILHREKRVEALRSREPDVPHLQRERPGLIEENPILAVISHFTVSGGIEPGKRRIGKIGLPRSLGEALTRLRVPKTLPIVDARGEH